MNEEIEAYYSDGVWSAAERQALRGDAGASDAISITYTPQRGTDRVKVPDGGKFERAYTDESGQMFVVVHHPINPSGIVEISETYAGRAVSVDVGDGVTNEATWKREQARRAKEGGPS